MQNSANPRINLKVDLRVDIADFMMNSSILVYRKVQPRSLTRALLVASLPPRPPAPPPAFLVLGQRPGSSPGESHQTAVYRRAPSRRVARVARVAPSPFARASVPPHENERKGRWYRRTRERRPARRSAGTPPTAKPTCPPRAVRVHVAAASCVCAWAWSGCRCGLAACGGPRLCVVSAVRLLTEVAFVEVADEASARSPTAKPTHPPTHPPCVVYVRAAAASCVWAWAWAWSGCAACTVLCSLSVPAVFLARLPRRAARGRATGRVSRRPFDATPPDLNRGAGLVPETQVAGRRRQRRTATGHPVRGLG